MLEEIFTKEECAYLYANAVNVMPKITWEEIEKKGVIIYGCGMVGKAIYQLLNSYDIQPLYFIDKKLAGKEYKNIKIYSPEKLNRIKDSFVLIEGNYIKEMEVKCKECNVKNVIYTHQLPQNNIGYFFEENFLEKLNSNKSFTDLFRILEDTESKIVLKNILSFRATQNYDFFQNYAIIDHYFPRNLKENFDYSVFCDCGAYNGDTFLQWMNDKEVQHKKYIGIEANKQNFIALQKTIEQYPQISSELYPNAVSKEKGKLYISENESSSSLSASIHLSGYKVDVIPLDEIISNDTTFIKMDIEGEEVNAIHGMKNFLQEKEKQKDNNKPVTLAISVYHKPEDIYEIPFLILKYAPSAKIYLRHHTQTVSETACYAII